LVTPPWMALMLEPMDATAASSSGYRRPVM
jgi:hypothetical protein